MVFAVSVIMPARNAAATIAQSLRSVLDQACLSEIIVVDDGSTDRTADIAIGMKDARIRVIQGPCTGISGALNAGFQAATGKFVARCDADDIFLPGRLAGQVQWLSTYPDYVAVSGGYISMDADGNKLSMLACESTGRDVSNLLRDGEVVTHFCTWLIRRSAIIAVGGARAWFDTAEDLDLQVRLAFEGDIWHDPVPVYGYRLHAASITHSRKLAQLAFFDDAVFQFARQRRQTGTDALDRGDPPEIPEFSDLAGKHEGLSAQMIGYLTSQAWADFHAGYSRDALRNMAKALRMSPFSVEQWRGLLVMIFKLVLKRS